MPALKQMDLDAFTQAHRSQWQRLGQLAALRRPSGAEIDELVEGFQSGATDLSALRTGYGETAESTHLSVRLARARLRLTGARANIVEVLGRFFVLQLPAALYRVRWWTAAAAAFTVIVAALTAWWVLANPAVLSYLGTESQLEQYATEDFVNYYSEYSETAFGARVFTNNAWIAAQCIAFGVTGFWVPYVLLQNAVGLGQTAAIMAHLDHLDVFFLWIAPHGLLELTMVFVAAGAGLKLFWAWIVPGPRSRLQALAEEGRSLITVAVGTTIFLFVSGFIEGFITRQPWPWPVKIGIGALALASYCLYAFWLGRRAALAGERGDLVAFERGARTISAD